MTGSSTQTIVERVAAIIPGAAWRVEIDCVTPSEWSQMLDLFADANIYQTWSYGSVRWGARNLSHVVVHRGGEILGMAQLRIVRPTRFKFGMAYLRWGPLWERRGRQLDPEVPVVIARALEQEYVDNRRLFLRILPNAFCGSQRAAVAQSAFCRFNPEPLVSGNTYRTFLLDLSPSLEELRTRLDKKWRNLLTSSEKKGLKIVAGTGLAEYQTFCSIYRQMRQRKRFETDVDVEEFGRIQQELPEAHRMRILICMDGSVPVAGLVASAIGDTAIYLLGATSDNGLNSRGAYLLQWTLINWLKESGFRWYDLGGIDPQQNPGVYHFKRGLGGTDAIQMAPLVCCTGVTSSVVARSGLVMRNWVRTCKAVLHGNR